jgi:RimJ/RimL family protein N-acetyltransferase
MCLLRGILDRARGRRSDRRQVAPAHEITATFAAHFLPDDSVKLLELDSQDQNSTLPINETNVDQWIEQQRAARFTRGESGETLAIELVEAKELAGYVWVHFSEPTHQTAGFALSITPSLRRQGLGLEAARTTLDFAFDGLCARRVSVSCPSADSAARKLLAKAGLRQEGELIKAWFDGEAWVNLSLYALLKEERPASA